jgi:feruloyl esterase
MVPSIALVILMLSATSAIADSASLHSATMEVQCEALRHKDFTRIQDAPTQIIKVTLVGSEGGVPPHCQVEGRVAPHVGIGLQLPLAHWNGKLIEVGCAANCGDLMWEGCNDPVRRGYACITSDMGHRGTLIDSAWAHENLQAKVDWAFRATHVTVLAGKAISAYFYRGVAKKSYFVGCSTGGRQALQEAQRFPWDFDGIIAGAPPINLSALYMTLAWNILATHDKDGKPLLDRAHVKLLTDTAIAKCDLDDGVKDGLIGDPRHCQFDPAELTCKGQQADSCLTPIQVDAVKKVYAGPTTSRGVRLSHGGPMPGSEYGHWDEQFGGNWSRGFLGVNGKPAAYDPLVISGLRFLFFDLEMGPNWTLSGLDFDRDYQRLGIMESLYDSGNPDLRDFKAAGGKLLMYQGTNDVAVLPQITEDYYETVERTMGGQAATQSFFRLFVLPGVEHCGGGDGADTVDYLSALEAWVEHGRVPDRLNAAHLRTDHSPMQMPPFPLHPGEIQFTRPVYPYPIRAQYRGRGDPEDAASFGPSSQ